MAKEMRGRRKPRAGSKAQAIRDEFSSQGASARPKDVISALKAKGISVSSAQVSNIKSTLGKKKRGRKAGAGHGTNGTLSLESLLEAKKLAERVGGVEIARQALEALVKLT
jgi:hypothetical protein